MIIRLKENINSVSGGYEVAKGEELEVSSYDQELEIYNCEIAWGINSSIIYEVCKESAEVVEDKKPVIEKFEHVTYNNEKNRVEYEFPNLDMKFKKEWEPVTCTEPKIERNCPKIKLLRALMSNCGQCKTSKDSVLDIIYTDNDKKIHLCKGPFSEAVTYDVPFFYGELMRDEKPVEQEVNSLSMGADMAILSAGEPEQEAKQKLPSKYHRANTLKHKDFIDFYDIINLLQSNGEAIPPEIQHALKKLMYNDRGHKNMIQDKKEASWSIDRWFENNEL